MRITALLSADVGWALQLAAGWRAAGDEVTVVLLDGAVAAARVGHQLGEVVEGLLETGVVVLAEEQAAARRGLGPDRTIAGVKDANLDQVADLLVDGSDKVVWL